MDAEEVLALLRESGALLEGHFELSSGLHSDRYFQCALALSLPSRAERLARAAAERVEGPVDLVVGPALGAVIWAQELGRALDRPALFTERQDGSMCLRRGFRIEPGARVLLAEDVVTTGRSSREALEIVRAQGGVPLAVAAIVNRSGGNPFESDGLPLHALAAVAAESWPPQACPLCARGGRAVKPGSRSGVSSGGRA